MLRTVIPIVIGSALLTETIIRMLRSRRRRKRSDRYRVGLSAWCKRFLPVAKVRRISGREEWKAEIGSFTEAYLIFTHMPGTERFHQLRTGKFEALLPDGRSRIVLEERTPYPWRPEIARIRIVTADKRRSPFRITFRTGA